MHTQERKEANRRGASFNREEVEYLDWALDMVNKTHNSYKSDVRIKLHAKVIKMRESFGD